MRKFLTATLAATFCIATLAAITRNAEARPKDTTPRTVTLTAPGNGATVSGSRVTVAATASDNDAVGGVTFQVNGITIGKEDTSAPYSAIWDTTAASNGSKTIVAFARDRFGNLITSSAITVTVNNPSSTITKNILTDFGAKCDGVADDATAFAKFNFWARSQTHPIVLTIPGGKTCTFKAYSAGSWFAKGVKNLTVIGYGATLSDNNGTGSFFLGGSGQFHDNQHSARLATVSVGSSTVRLLDPAKTSLFKVGNWALITGFDLQGLWQRPYGYPSNPHYFEYVQVTQITSAGEITFAATVKNTYMSTWPNYNSGNSFEVDSGGPATLYALDPSWDTDVEYQGLTIARPTAQTYANGRSVTYRDVTFTGRGGAVPSQNLIWTAIKCNLTYVLMEVDKLVGTIVLDSIIIRGIGFQSSSVDLLQMTNSNVTRFISGTPKKAVISDSTITEFKVGAYAYGRSDEVICNNCVISNLGAFGVSDKGPNDVGVDNAYKMNNGVISISNTYGAVRWAVPGTNLMWMRYFESETAFQVLDVTQDANNTYVQTTMSGGFPPVPYPDRGVLAIRVHPAPKFTCSNCTGSKDAVDLSQAQPGAPLYSYSKRTYDGSLVRNASLYRIWGKLVSFKINVTKAYTGPTGSLTFSPLGQFHYFSIKLSDYSVFGYMPRINLRVAGERIVTPASVTGQQNDDTSLSVPEPVWFGAYVVSHMNTDISHLPTETWPSVTVEIITDQRVVNP